MKKRKKVILSDSQKKALKKLKIEIETNPTAPYSIQSLSVELQMNRNKLYHGFFKLCEKTIHQYIILHRIKRAKKMLRQSDGPIKAIAVDSGYKNVKNFHTAFKLHTGKTPLAYRKGK